MKSPLKPIRETENELKEAFIPYIEAHGFKNIEYIGYKEGSLRYRAKEKDLKAAIRIDLYSFHLYVRTEDYKELEFHYETIDLSKPPSNESLIEKEDRQALKDFTVLKKIK